jgi:integrase
MNLAEGVWTVPGERMKARREHRVPLSPQALELLRQLKPAEPSAPLFPNYDGKPLSDGALLRFLQRDMGRETLTQHGFRSTFRDWAAECTAFPAEVAEMALAHVVKDKTEAAYRRGDLFDKRRELMTAWAAYCTSGETQKPNVI